ncbi:helix-turn-helix domain-containing protein [Streptomyces cinereoruber]|uniref:helix-turn-helix domain-containing protein n=1 Tax=Streptomyces cinereoruber TaxID=67260 RepID=UPI00362B8192
MSDHVQSVRNAWINRLRDEALRARRPEVSKAAHIGILIATYADADGSRAFPSKETLAAIAGVSEDTITRCVRLLMAADLLGRRRRPNQSSMYQLLIPTARIDWTEHLHVWGETRQAKARRKAKAAEIAALLAEREAAEEGNPPPDMVRNPSAAGVPEPVPGGGSETSGTRPRTGTDTVPGRVPEPVPGGGLPVPPTCGRDPGPDQTMAAVPPQPQDAGGRASGKTIPQQPTETQGIAVCVDCAEPIVREGLALRCGCKPQASNARTPSGPVQGTFLISLPSGAPPGPRSPVQAPQAPPAQVCACGRCPDCLAADRERATGTG